ncbi:MAG: hypothetical protein AAGE03_02550 [Pseudomonadota bacterium]
MTHRDTLALTRDLKASPARLFDALISPKARTLWGPPGPDMVVLIKDQPAPAEGVREVSRCGPRDDPSVTVWTDWIILTPPSRVICAETLIEGGAHLGVTLAQYDISETAMGSHLDLHLTLASFIGAEMIDGFKDGWTHALANLIDHLEGAA